MSLTVWRLTDGKAGHDSQSQGLCKALRNKLDITTIDIGVSNRKYSAIGYLFRSFPAGKGLPEPTFIIGAGHATHWPMLAAKRAYGGNSVVLMKPGLPLSMFDYCLVPEHDSPPHRKNIISTCGALNGIEYIDKKSVDTGLILLGGPSAHYEWNAESVRTQIRTILENHMYLSWYLADSPRTPKNFINNLALPKTSKYQFLHYTDTPSAGFHEHIARANIIWVSEDSVSMIYEALTAGAQTALIELDKKRRDRIAGGVLTLVKNGYLTTYRQWQKQKSYVSKPSRLNEAARCADLLIKMAL